MKKDKRIITADFLGPLAAFNEKDLIKRSLIRHDSEKLAEEIIKIVNNVSSRRNILEA